MSYEDIKDQMNDLSSPRTPQDDEGRILSVIAEAQPADIVNPISQQEPVAYRHSKTGQLYDSEEEVPRIVCWFSCGAASAVATKLTIAQYGAKNVTVARCIVREEHEDNDRFAADCEKWFGVPITNLINEQYDGSVVNVIEARKYVSGIHGAPCTMLLKKRVREDWQLPTDRHVFGYTADAKDMTRWDDFLDANNIDAVAPLIDRGLQHSDCLAMVENAGLVLPTMYLLDYHHNNCIGCVKAGGQGYWNKIRVDFPIVFHHRAEQTRRMGARILMVNGVHKFLDEITPGAGDYQSEPEIQCGVFCHMAQSEYAA